MTNRHRAALLPALLALSAGALTLPAAPEAHAATKGEAGFKRTVLRSTWISLDGSPAGAEGALELDTTVSVKAGQSTFRLHLPGVWLDDVDIDGRRYQAVRLPEIDGYDATDSTAVGHPAVPRIPLTLGVVTSAEVVTSSAKGAASRGVVTLNNIRLEPFNPTVEDEPSPFIVDRDAYSLDAFVPSRDAQAAVGRWGGARVAPMDVTPIQYNALRQTLTLATDLKVTFAVPGQIVPPICADRSVLQDRSWRNALANYGQIQSALGQVAWPVYNPDHYLVITAQRFAGDPALEELIAKKRALGLDVQVRVAGEGFTNSCAGIQGLIRERREAWLCGDTYVLLVGDLADVASCTYNGGDEPGAVSDYALTTVLGSDDYPDVFLGRLSADNSADLGVQIDKILAYDQPQLKSPFCDTRWLDRVELAAHREGYPDKYTGAMEEVRTAIYDAGDPIFSTVYGGDPDPQPNRNADLLADLDRGRGMLMYRGHGSSAGYGGWDADGDTFVIGDELRRLDNGAKTPIVMSIACDTGDFRASDSFGEEIMSKVDGGAVAHFGATANSWTGANHSLAKAVMRGVWDEGIAKIGPALQWGVVKTLGQGQDRIDNAYIYGLLGDPHMTIRTDSCVGLNLSGLVLVPEWEPDVLIYEVHGLEGDPLEGVLVSVTAPGTGQVIATGVTGPGGVFEAPISLPAGTPLVVTAGNDGILSNNVVGAVLQ